MNKRRTSWSRVVLALFFVVAGVGHFLSPASYLQIMPPLLPWPKGLVAISGLAEILGGLGLLLPLVRPAAAIGLIALLVCVFPANIYALAHGMTVAGKQVPAWLLWARLPFQPLLVAWVYRSYLRRSNSPAATRSATPASD